MEKIELIHGTTGLYKLNYSIGNINIYMKRDDLLDFAFGGNKVRLFEYIGAMVKKEECRQDNYIWQRLFKSHKSGGSSCR